jgi:thioredoxin 1
MIGALPEKRDGYGRTTKMLVILAVLIAIAAVVLIKGQAQRSRSSPDGRRDESMKSDTTKGPTSSAEHMIPAGPSRPAALPRLVDLGADKCIPCKMMAPILEELKEEYKETFKVDFIDVWKDPAVGQKWRIRLIPTQIFLDGTGKELYRHEGFFSKEDILGKWEELGVDVQKKVGVKGNPGSEIQLVSMRACCQQPKIPIPGWEVFRP